MRPREALIEASGRGGEDRELPKVGQAREDWSASAARRTVAGCSGIHVLLPKTTYLIFLKRVFFQLCNLVAFFIYINENDLNLGCRF